MPCQHSIFFKLKNWKKGFFLILDYLVEIWSKLSFPMPSLLSTILPGDLKDGCEPYWNMTCFQDPWGTWSWVCKLNWRDGFLVFDHKKWVAGQILSPNNQQKRTKYTISLLCYMIEDYITSLQVFVLGSY